MRGDAEIVGQDNLNRRIALDERRVLQGDKSLGQHGVDHGRRRRLSGRRREREAGHGDLLGVPEARHGDGAFDGRRGRALDGVGVAPEPEVVEVEGREFGSGVEDREGRGPVGGLVLGRGGDDVGGAVGEGAVEGVVEGPGVEELGARGKKSASVGLLMLLL